MNGGATVVVEFSVLDFPEPMDPCRVAEAVERVVNDLADRHTWLLAPPEVEVSLDDDPDECDIGCAVEVYDVWRADPLGLASETVHAQRELLGALFDAMVRLSGELGLTLGIDLGGHDAGLIEAGEPTHVARTTMSVAST